MHIIVNAERMDQPKKVITEHPIECDEHQRMVVVTVYEDGSKRCSYPGCPFEWRCTAII